jgi:hypothetical protein
VYLHGTPSGWWLHVLDVSRPDALQEIALMEVPVEVSRTLPSVVLEGHLAYLGSHDAFHVIDLQDPARPAVLTRIRGFIGSPVVLQGSYAMAGNALIDLWDPLKPRLAGGWTWSGSPLGMVDGRLFISDVLVGLQWIQPGPALPPATILDGRRLSLDVPPGLPPGRYHVVALQPDGEQAVLTNAVQVTAPPGLFPPGNQ